MQITFASEVHLGRCQIIENTVAPLTIKLACICIIIIAQGVPTFHYSYSNVPCLCLDFLRCSSTGRFSLEITTPGILLAGEFRKTCCTTNPRAEEKSESRHFTCVQMQHECEKSWSCSIGKLSTSRLYLRIWLKSKSPALKLKYHALE